MSSRYKPLLVRRSQSILPPPGEPPQLPPYLQIPDIQGSSDDIAGLAGIDVTLFKNYNPDLNCSFLPAGQELCIGPGAQIKNINVIGEIEVTNNNPVVTTLSATGVNVVHLDAEGSGKVLSPQLKPRSEATQSD
ncbi:hypothetical protein H0H93_003893 [Arthromyces matolae]|nr:hypothetical protein H0H93_003893 [Arthromyces matolae]